MNAELVAAMAQALGVSLPEDRREAVSTQLQGLLLGRGGFPAAELEGVEPAIVFEPWRDA